MIEDSAADAVIIQSRIEEVFSGSKILVATSLSAAYDLYRREMIDIVLLDLNLPDGYGAKTVEEVRRFCKRQPIIVLSDMDGGIEAHNARQFGAVEFMSKNSINSDSFASILRGSLIK